MKRGVAEHTVFPTLATNAARNNWPNGPSRNSREAQGAPELLADDEGQGAREGRVCQFETSATRQPNVFGAGPEGPVRSEGDGLSGNERKGCGRDRLAGRAP
jgi:hypothetical protein